MKTSYKKIILFNVNSNEYIKLFPNEDKVIHVLNRINLRIEPFFAEYKDMVEDIEIELANTDKNRSILKSFGPKGETIYDFEPEKWIERKKRLKELFDKEIFEVNPCIIPVPDSMPDDFRQVFEGFIFEVKEVIKPETEA